MNFYHNKTKRFNCRNRKSPLLINEPKIILSMKLRRRIIKTNHQRIRGTPFLLRWQKTRHSRAWQTRLVPANLLARNKSDDHANRLKLDQSKIVSRHQQSRCLILLHTATPLYTISLWSCHLVRRYLQNAKQTSRFGNGIAVAFYAR